MASAISHALVVVGVGAILLPPSTPKRVWIVGSACSVAPDLDAIGFHLGVPYGALWGHRGFTHSLVFAALLATLVTFAAFRNSPSQLSRAILWAFLFAATASHGLLDALTDGGLGVAFFSPFDTTRYFLPWRPIAVSPISVTRFFSARGLAVLQSEFLWIWLPSLCVAALAVLFRRTRPVAQT